MKDIEIGDIKNITESTIDRTKNVLEWISQPKEEARDYLIESIKKNSNLTDQEKGSLIYNSRKFTREYLNSKRIYEQAKEHYTDHSQQAVIDDDWLHFFFDKAEKVSNKSMQVIWAKMLAGEFNKPGSISRKLMHIISVMDVNSAKSFQTLCMYVFKRYGLMTSYNTDALFIPSGFYTNSFEFMLKVEKWLLEAGYSNNKDLALSITMNTGELNSLENLGLIQLVPEAKCGIPLVYSLSDSELVYIRPQDDDEIPLGTYSLTQEGEQLYKILNQYGDKAILIIIDKYLKEKGKKFIMDKYF